MPGGSRPPDPQSRTSIFISTSIMSNLNDSSDTIDLCAPPQAEARPLPVNGYPLLGLALMLVSAVLTSTAAYYFLADW